MYFAKDPRTGAIISADVATARRLYDCPTCGEEVFLRRGSIRVAHFAHCSGRADSACENYHPGSTVTGPLLPWSTEAISGPAAGRLGSLALGMRVEAANAVRRGDKRRWRLVLVAPKSTTAGGRVRIPTGFGSASKEIRLSTLLLDPQFTEVSPNARFFGAEWVSDEVDSQYRSIVQDRIDGFEDRAQVFSYSPLPLKPRTANLHWGNAYYIIWPRRHIAVPEALGSQSLADQEGWSAAFIMLPAVPDPEVVTWLAELGLNAIRGGRHWGIMHPPPLNLELDGGLTVFETPALALRFVDTAADRTNPTTLSISSSGDCREVDLAPQGNNLCYVRVKGLQEPLGLQWGAMRLPSIRLIPVPGRFTDFPAVRLRARDAMSGGELELALHRPEARDALNRMRRGQAELLDLSVPRGISGTVEQRRAGGQWEPVLELQGEEHEGRDHGSLPAATRTLLCNHLVDRSADFRMSFGVFGHFESLASLQSAISATRLSPDTRRRLTWYCRAVGSPFGQVTGQAGRSSDDILIEAFRRAPPQPRFIAYRNLLHSRLRRESARGTDQ